MERLRIALAKWLAPKGWEVVPLKRVQWVDGPPVVWGSIRRVIVE